MYLNQILIFAFKVQKNLPNVKSMFAFKVLKYSKSNFDLFADYTSIFCSHSDPSCLESVLNEELQNFDVWLKCNKLSVNIKKTNYVIFKSRQKKLD